MSTSTNPITALVRASRERDARARELRPGYFARRDALLASGAFRVEGSCLRTVCSSGRRLQPFRAHCNMSIVVL